MFSSSSSDSSGFGYGEEYANQVHESLAVLQNESQCIQQAFDLWQHGNILQDQNTNDTASNLEQIPTEPDHNQLTNSSANTSQDSMSTASNTSGDPSGSNHGAPSDGGINAQFLQCKEMMDDNVKESTPEQCQAESNFWDNQFAAGGFGK
jgi:hypothetical protein